MIPCIVRDAASETLAENDSLAENMQRVAVHPFDPFRAFVALRDKGQGEEAIAEVFFVAPQIVKQRLKLASVAPALLEVYAEDGMTLEQLMAFTEIARAGAFVTLDREGSLAVYRGYVRPKGEPREESAVQDVDGAEDVELGGQCGYFRLAVLGCCGGQHRHHLRWPADRQ